MGGRVWGGIAVALLLFVTSPTTAQPNIATLVTGAREQVARDLEASFQVRLIRERRLADDQQEAALARHEMRIRSLRQRATAAGRVATLARTELAAARAEFARLANEISGRESTLRAELNAYRVEAGQIAFAADPAKLAALQQFADGDRVGAWPVIEELTQAEVRVQIRAASVGAAERVANLAALREIMRDRGEATARDVLTLWNQVVALNPDHFEGQLQKVGLASLVGDHAEAVTAGEAALRLAANPEERWRTAYAMALAARTPEARRRYAEAATTLARQLVAGDPASVPFRRHLATSLSSLGPEVAREDLDASGRLFDEGLEISRRLVAADPGSVVLRAELAESLNDRGRLLNAFSDISGSVAAFEEQVAVARTVVRDAPGSLSRRHSLAQGLRSYAAMLTRMTRFDDAKRALDEMLAIAQALHRADEGSALYRHDVADALYNLHELEKARGDEQAALQYIEQAVGIRPDEPTRTALAEAYMQVGDLANARRSLEDIIRSVGEDRADNFLNYSLGRVLLELGEVAAAAARFERSVAILRQQTAGRRVATNDRMNLAVGLRASALARLRLGERERALGHFREVYDIVRGLMRDSPGLLEEPMARIQVYRELSNSAFNLAYFGNSVPWSEVRGYYEILQQMNALPESEQPRYDMARERSATP